MKIRIEIDENMPEDEIVIRCAQPDERVLKMKRAAESAEGDPEIAFFKDAVQFYPPLDSILFFECGMEMALAGKAEKCTDRTN